MSVSSGTTFTYSQSVIDRFLNISSTISLSQTFTVFKEAIGKEITSIGQEITKAVNNSVKKKAQDCIQSGGHQFKNG